MKTLLLILIASISLWGLTTELLKAHQMALKAYRSDLNLSILLMKEAEIDELLHQQPKKMTLKHRSHLLNDYGFFLYKAKRYDEALMFFHRTIQINPNRKIAYLNLGDAFRERYKKYQNDKDQQSCKNAYTRYVESLRLKSNIPKVPFRVAEELFLKNKMKMPYPDEWGYEFGDCSLYKQSNSFIQYLINNDYLINVIKLNNSTASISLRHFLFFSRVEVILDKTEQNQFDLYVFKGFPKQIAFKTQYPYMNRLKIQRGDESDYYPFSRYVRILDNNGTEHQFHPMYFCNKQIVGYYLRPYIKGGSEVSLKTHVADIASSGKFMPLRDESFLVVDGSVAIRLTKEGLSKAPFFNQTFFMPKREEYQLFRKAYLMNWGQNNLRETNITDDEWWFSGYWHQHNFDAAYKYLEDNKLIKGQ